MNPQQSVLETDALPIELPAYEKNLAGFLMRRMFVTPRTILLQLHTLGVVGLILVRGVIPTLTVSAS